MQKLISPLFWAVCLAYTCCGGWSTWSVLLSWSSFVVVHQSVWCCLLAGNWHSALGASVGTRQKCTNSSFFWSLLLILRTRYPRDSARCAAFHSWDSELVVCMLVFVICNHVTCAECQSWWTSFVLRLCLLHWVVQNIGKAAEDDISKLGPVLNIPFAVPALELSPFAGVESCCGLSSLDVWG